MACSPSSSAQRARAKVASRLRELRLDAKLTARVVRCVEREPDPDSGHVRVRRRCSVAEAMTLLNRGQVAEEQAKAATRIAGARWQLTSRSE